MRGTPPRAYRHLGDCGITYDLITVIRVNLVRRNTLPFLCTVVVLDNLSLLGFVLLCGMFWPVIPYC